MKEKINKILWDFAQSKLTHEEATQQVLDLFAVVGRSEQLKDFLSTMIEEFDNGGVSWETRDSAESLLKSL